VIVRGIDPGPNGARAEAVVELVNGGLRIVKAEYSPGPMASVVETAGYDAVVIEKCVCYGMAVGSTVFDTVLTAGQLVMRHRQEGNPVYLVPNPDWRACLCGFRQAKAKDVRARLIDLYGPVGTPKEPGPLFCIRGADGEHIVDAIGIATAFLLWKQETGKDVAQYVYPPPAAPVAAKKPRRKGIDIANP
jgi:hypothetical protein